jgi:Ca2+-binding RTX toxin-like protein
VLVDYAGEDGESGVTVNLASSTATDSFGDTDTLHGVTHVIGTRQDDHFIGDATDDFFNPSDGVDAIDGGDGSDTLFYGNIDQFNLDLSSEEGITVNMGAEDNAGTVIDPNGDTDTFINIEHIVGSTNDDTFNNDLFDAWFSGGAGDDIFNGSEVAKDTVDYSLDVIGGGLHGVTVNLETGQATDGFGDHDTLNSIDNITGTQFADMIFGNSDGNRLEGGAGNDTISGGAGADVIVGGLGADIMQAGLLGSAHSDFAQDTFIFNSVAEIGKGKHHDKIFDFEVGFGGDIVDLTAIDANSHRHGNQDFKDIFADHFHHKAGELRVVINGAVARIEGDVNGDGKADFQLDVQSGFNFSTDNLHGIIPVN